MRATSSGKMTVVASIWSTSAGPAMTSPGLRSSRQKAGVVIRAALVKQTSRVALADGRRSPVMAGAAQGAAIGAFVALLVAFAALIYAFVTSDFSVANVAANSHTAKPLLYKVAGAWGSHEGSMLLWCLVLTGYGAAMAFFGDSLPPRLRAYAIAIQGALGVLAHQALRPEERGEARAAGHRLDLVDAGRRVEHQVAGRQLDPLAAVGVLDHQLAAVVFVRVAEEQRGGQVGAYPLGAVAHLAHRVVDVEAEVAAGRVAVEQRREHLVRQGGGHEQRVLPQARQHRLADLARQRIVLGQLQVVLGLRRLVAGGDPAVLPVGFLQRLADTADLVAGEHLRYVQQHGAPPWRVGWFRK